MKWLELANQYRAVGDNYMANRVIQFMLDCQHSELDHNVCIECGEIVEMRYEWEPEINPER